MATTLPVRPRLIVRASHSYVLVESLYNEEFVRPMADFAVAEIQTIEPTAEITRVVSPGAFEIPLIIQTMIERKKCHAILAFGVILKGETLHAELIAEAVTRELLRISLEFRIPVVHEVLLLTDKQQARARCLEPQLNRGIEGARAAINAVRILGEIAGPK